MLADPPSRRRPFRRRLATFLLPLLLGTTVVLGLYAPLLSPARTLAARDVATFHLPLRVDLARLVRAGDLSWNPYLHGGQPLLSNPSYAACYPFTWLVAVFPADTALDLTVVLHAVLGFAGAWWLARRLGCGAPGAALAAVGFSASGGVLSLLHALNLYTGMAWFPWVLAAGDRTLAAPAGRWLRPALATAVVLALTMLNGEPVTVSIAVLGLAALAAGRWIDGLRSRQPGVPRGLGWPLRLAAPLGSRAAACCLLAAALASAQIVPTLARLADSPRAGALAVEASAAWSAPPQRVVELLWPRFFGDPMRVQEDLWFGWRLHDRDFPYVASLYPGLLISILAAVALVRRSTPRRWAWWLAIAAGAFLALGRHNPAFGGLLEVVPWLARLRYPEKYALLAVAVLPFVAALGWESLLAERRRGGEGRQRVGALDLPLALAVVAGVVSLGLAAALARWPGLRTILIRRGDESVPPAEVVAAAVRFLVSEAWMAALTAAAIAGLFALLRWRRSSLAMLAGAAVALLAADLGRVGHGMVRTLPAEEYRQPPALIASAPAVHRGRLFSDQAFTRGPGLVLRGADPGLSTVRTHLRRLDPYTPNLWGVSLALHEDYDLMLTGWARHALAALHHDYGNPRLALRQLGAWEIGHLVLHRSAADLAARLARGEAVEPAELRRNPDALPRYRFVPQVEHHPDVASALAAARAGGFAVARREDWVSPGHAAGPEPPRPAARVVGRDERGGRVRIDYEAPAGGYLVAAITFDEGWRGSVAGQPVPLFATALGQIGAELPATGERPRSLRLRYRDPWVAVGIGLALAAWLGVAGAALVRRFSPRADRVRR